MAKSKKFTKNTVEKMTVKQYSDHRKVERQTVYKHIRNGKLSKSVYKLDGKIKIDPVLADQELSENLDQVYHPRPEPRRTRSKKKPPTKPEMEQVIRAAGLENLSLSEAQRLQANYKASLLKLELDQKSGLLVEKDKVRAEAFEAGRIVRDGILNIPDRLSAELASCTDVHAVSQKLMDAFNEVLGDLSDK
jgi:hypothetical protein